VADYPSLKYIPIGMLLSVGDPWQADETLQSGDPGEIAQLATAFRDAGECTSETYNEFAQARERFHASWNHEDGAHPIDDSAAVQRATTRLLVQKDQLPLIAVDLQNIAADLAEAEKQSASKIDDLNGKLQMLDMRVGDAIADDRDYSKVVDDAEELTRLALSDIERIKDQYTDKLEQAAFDLRLKHGYDPVAIEDVDGAGDASAEERGRTAPEHYDANQRAMDEALVNSGGPMTPEKAAAEARLRDYAIATNPTTDPQVSPEKRALAAQRLDDFRMANFVGPLPTDRMLGGDARTRAQSRLEMQRQLEQGVHGTSPLSADDATRLLNDGESRARVRVLQDAYTVLTAEGVSGEGAEEFLTQISDGVPWNELAQHNIDLINAAADGAGGYASSLPVNAHDLDRMTLSDAHAIAEFAKYTGRAATLFDALSTYQQIKGGAPVGETAGEFVGGTALGGLGAWGAALGVASVAPPGWVFVAAVVAGVGLGEVGKWAGGKVGSSFD
jgi:Hydrolase N-terminal helical domain